MQTNLIPMLKIHQLSFLLAFLILAACQPSQSPEVKEAGFSQSEDIEQKLKDMGVELYELPQPEANFVRAVQTGKLVFLAGHGPMTPEGKYITGKLGQDLSIEEGQQAARYTGITLLSALKAEIGDLNKVSRIVKVHGMVNGTSDFTDQPKVMNGFSDFIVEVFGEKGKHARAAVGMGSLPSNIAVEIEMIVEVEE
ncbi:RidA family protein [Porifericola rhodea]|uniref:RidA family protein n=1 Tax=Porifericola rhodea TaxID=930972 RepID=UPI002666673E|nr:RidA family protein [Porifericola rhodea]WKN32558.1 RidA family protein [Porifericola rhodea]